MQTEIEIKPLSVLQLNQQIKNLIEGGMGTVWIKAEISNFKPHSSGHYYLSLKDEQSQIRAVMFRGHNSKLKFKPTDGQLVLARGQISVYAPRGEYQIYIEHMEPIGQGSLQKAFEDLKIKLKAEGLFDLNKKRTLPLIPKGIAVVTSPTGAAIQDILNILKRRAPQIPVIVVPTLVQGAQAAPQLLKALQLAYKLKEVDVIIVGRGGGSIEDMWCFNDEGVARTIAQSPVPIISAVGHEIDFTIADFVADLRAPTPSAAAELVASNQAELVDRLRSFKIRLIQNWNKQLKFWLHSTHNLRQRLIDPKRRIQDLLMRQAELHERLQSAVSNQIKSRIQKHQQLWARYWPQQKRFDIWKLKILNLTEKLGWRVQDQLKDQQHRLHHVMGLLDTLSPLQVLNRGFSITRDARNELLTSVAQVKTGDLITTQTKDGKWQSMVTQIDK